MKKLVFTLLTFLSCGASYALPVGNPADPVLLCDGFFLEGSCCRLLDICDPGASWCEAFNLRAGYYGDFVFQRSMEIDRHEASDFIENTEIFTNAAFLVLNIWDRIDLFTTLGATNIFFDTNASAFYFSGGLAVSGNRFEVETETHFSWSVGARIVLWQCGCTYIGAEAQYFYSNPDIERVTLGNNTIIANGSAASTYPDDVLSLKYREWQFGLGISHRINFIVPYAAIKWAHAQMDPDDALISFNFNPQEPGNIVNFRLHNLESRKDVGYALGVTFTDCSKKSLTIEARFADEKALYVNGQIRF